MPDEENGTETQEAEVKVYDESHVRKLNAEAAANRVRAKEAEAKVEDLAKKIQEYEDRDKSELDKALSKLAEAEATNDNLISQMKEIAVRDRVISECQKLEVVDPEAVYKMLDIQALADDPKAIKKAVENLIKSKQYLVKRSQPPAPGVGGRPIQGKPTADQQMVNLFKGNRR